LIAVALRRTRVLIARSVQEFFEDRCPLIAAAIAYYGLFSLFPMAILVVGAFSVFADDAAARQAVIDVVLDNLPLRPGEGRRELERLLESVAGNAAAFGAAGLAALVFAASGLMGAVRNGINAAFDSETRRPPLQGKLVDVALVFGVGVVVAVTLGLSLMARLVQLPFGFATAWLIPVAVSFVVFGSIYRLLPDRDVRFRDVWPGAVLATAGYQLAKEAFALYLESFGRYGAIYGALGAVAAFLVFAFVVANVFLLGAEAASEWRGVREAEPASLEKGPPASTQVRRMLRRLVSRPAPRR
jgi:membrane protein